MLSTCQRMDSTCGRGVGESAPGPLQSVENKLNLGRSPHNKMSESNNKCGDTSRKIHTEPFSEFYSVEEQIGRGKFAVVKKCRHKQTGSPYAAKFLRKRRKGKDCRHVILQEIAMLEAAHEHPQLIDLVEVYETNHELVLVTEYACGGELHHQVISEDYLPEPDVKRLMRQILSGLMFLHENNIVHLDVKPQNILLTQPFPHGDVKLCDFGFARRITKDEDVLDIIGTPDYVAPEVLSYEPIQTTADMWSVGVVAYVLLTGYSPFACDDKQETFLNISKVNLDFPDDLFGRVSQEAQDFISKLLVRNPRRRPTARECLSHPWLTQSMLSVPGTLASSLSSSTEKISSPLGSRRALAPSTPDSSLELEEPSKRCRCDGNDMPSTPVANRKRQDTDINTVNVAKNMSLKEENKSCSTKDSPATKRSHDHRSGQSHSRRSHDTDVAKCSLKPNHCLSSTKEDAFTDILSQSNGLLLDKSSVLASKTCITQMA